MKFLLMAGISALLIISGLLSSPHSLGQTQAASTSDFATAVQAGVQSLAINPGARSQQQEIQNQDYKSTWDEFGINTLVDGSMPPAEVNNRITQDIVQSVETTQDYNQQEASYLQATQITPEQVRATEGLVGADIPPSQPIDLNPSVDANPNVNISPVDTSIQDNTENNASSSDMGAGNVNVSTSTNEITTETNVTEMRSSTQEASTSIDNTTTSTVENVSSTLDIDASTTDMSASSSESAIYKAILQGEQTQPADQTGSVPENNVSPPASPADNAPPAP